MSDNTQIAKLRANFDNLHHLRSESNKNCASCLSTQEPQRSSACALSEPAPWVPVTLASLAHQTYLLREALSKSPNRLKAICGLVCDTIRMLEAYAQPEIPTMDNDHRFIVNISNNIEGARAVYETLQFPEPCMFSILMERLSRAFDKLLDRVFESGYRRENGLDNAPSGPQSKNTRSMIVGTGSGEGDRGSALGAQDEFYTRESASRTSAMNLANKSFESLGTERAGSMEQEVEAANAQMNISGTVQRSSRHTPRSDKYMLQGDILEPAEALEQGVTYLKMTLPENFTIPSRSAFVPTRMYPKTSTLLLIPGSAENSAVDYILYVEDESGPGEDIAPHNVEGGQRIWLKDAVESWWKSIGHAVCDAEAWTAFIGSERLFLLAGCEPILSPCGNLLKNVDRDPGCDRLDYSDQDDCTVVPYSYHKIFYDPLDSPRAESKKEICFSKTFLPAGFKIPANVKHAENSTLSDPAIVYSLPTGLSQKQLREMLCRNSEYRSSVVAATPIRSPESKRQLQDAIEARWTTMGVEAKSPDNWRGFHEDEMYIVSESGSGFHVQPSMMLSLRGGGSDIESEPGNRHSSFADDFERLWDELLRQNAEACGHSAPSSCTEAWIKLASLLQIRNGYLEHQVRELQDMNGSLAEDVEWHVNALAKLEEELKETELDRAAAWAKVLDLKAELSCPWSPDASHQSEADDGESTYTDMTGSDGSKLSMSCNPDIDTNISYKSQQRGESTHGATVQNKLESPQVRAVPQAGAEPRANTFYFCPRTSLILLMTSPPKPYQFAAGSTLPQIHQRLIRHYHEDVQDDPIFQIMNILDLREYLGIQVPDPVRDEVVRIGLPDLDALTDLSDEVSLAAWEAIEVDSHLSDKAWQDGRDVVRSSSCPLLEHACSDVSGGDANKLFSDWSRVCGEAGTARLPDEQSQSA